MKWLLSILLGIIIGWLIISFINKPVSYYVQAPVIGRDLTEDENMLIAVGLATRTPARKSIMDSGGQVEFTPVSRDAPPPPVSDEAPMYVPTSPQFLAPIAPPQSYVYTPVAPAPVEVILQAYAGGPGPAPADLGTGSSQQSARPGQM